MPWSKTNLPDNVESISKKEKWTDSQIDTFVKTANAVLDDSGDEGESIATGIDMARSLNNELEESKRIPPKEAQANAQRVLDWRDKHGDEVKGMTQVGWTRARQIASGKPLSMDVISRISQFKRHQDNAKINPDFKGEPWKDKGYVAWLGWGGDSAILEWSPKVMDMKEKTNAMKEPEVLYCRHMKSGVAGYEDETIYIGDDALKQMMPTMSGIPVYVHHQAVDLEKLQEQADGYISECFYNELDGWYWAKFIAVSDGAHTAVSNGWSVSNAYLPTEWANGGTCHNVPYDREILNGRYTHLAIVDTPRYEQACIMSADEFKAYQASKKTELEELTNSKGNDNKKGMLKMKLSFWEKKEVVNSVDAENTMLGLDGEEPKSLKEIMNELSESRKKEKSEEAEKDNEMDMEKLMNMEVEYEGEMTTYGAIMDDYKSMKKAMKKNEMDEKKESEKKEAEKEKDMKNSVEAGKTHLETLQNAMQSGAQESAFAIPETQADKIARGKSKY